MLNTAFEPWPSFTPEEANAVQQVLLSNRVNYWTGQECREFEKEFAHYVGTPFAVALANGTVALDVALKALGIGAGDDGFPAFERLAEAVEHVGLKFGQFVEEEDAGVCLRHRPGPYLSLWKHCCEN